MKMVSIGAVGGLMLFAAQVAQAAAPEPAGRPAPAPGVEAVIPFADSVGIRDFSPDGDQALWIQGQDRRWYHAELMGRCWGLDSALKVGFVTRGTGSLDRFSQIVVDGARCPISSVKTSAPPPDKSKDKGTPPAGR